MRAWTFTSRGPPSKVLALRSDLPQPLADSLKPDEVLIRVSHVGIFQGFATLMQLLPHFNNTPWIPASDFSGTIAARGALVSEFKPGDAVFGASNPKLYHKYGGVLAEYVILPAGMVVHKPQRATFEEAAGLAGNGCTVLQFTELTRMKRGDRILVTAGSSATGALAVQASKAVVGREGIVVATCSGANEQLVRNLGADEVIDYKLHSALSEYLADNYATEPFDIIIDIAGSDECLCNKSASYLKPDGTFMFGGKIKTTHGSKSFFDMVSFVFSAWWQGTMPIILGGSPRKCMFHSGNLTKKDLESVADMVENQKLKGLVDSVWEMESAVKAYERVATGHARGKVIVHVQD